MKECAAENAESIDAEQMKGKKRRMFSPMAVFPKDLAVKTPRRRKLRRNHHQGCAKAINAQCYTELPWLRHPFPLLRMVPYDRLLLPQYNACKLLQTP